MDASRAGRRGCARANASNSTKLGDAVTALELDDVSRTFESAGGERTAVAHLSLRVGPGEILCLLGPNGAGKTTTVRMASTLLRPTSGRVTIAGVDAVSDPREARRSLGLVLGGDRGFYMRASARENVRFFAMLQGLTARDARKRTEVVLEQVGLADRACDPVEAFSRGMRQRLHIARALTSSPRLLLLDEPSTGLDPQTARDLRSLIRGLVDDGAAILLTTHDMREAEQLADRVAVINQGRMVAHGGVPDIARSAGVAAVMSWQVPAGSDASTAPLERVPGVRAVVTSERNGITMVDVLLSPDANVAARVRDAVGLHVLAGPTERSATLEEAYLALLEPADA